MRLITQVKMIQRRERRGLRYPPEIVEKLAKLDEELFHLLQVETCDEKLRAWTFKTNMIVKYYTKTRMRIVRIERD
jgi:hypothetical protein